MYSMRLSRALHLRTMKYRVRRRCSGHAKPSVGRRVLHLGAAGRHQDADADEHDDADGNPHGGDVEQEGRDAQSDDQDDEANEVGAEC